jgi:large subunit ribosomal protein L17
MRHQKAGLKLGRTTSHRTAMFRNMVTSLLKYERIQTTDIKAKELKRWADNIITLAKRGDLHARRQALSIVREKDVVNKLFAEAAERFGSRAGGYTRIVKLGRRPGDAAPVSMIELIAAEKTKSKEKKAKKKGAKAAKPKTKKDSGVQAKKGESASAAQDAAPDEATAEKPKKKIKTKAVLAKDTDKKAKTKKDKTSEAIEKADDSSKKD